MFDQEQILPQILDRLAEGTPLEEICRTPGMPKSRTIREWVEKRPPVSAEVARARAAGYDVIASDCLTIADDGRNDWMAINGDDDVGWRANGEHIQRSRLRVDTRLKLLACWDSKRYGAKVQQEVDLTVRVAIADPTRQLRNASAAQQVSAQGAPTLPALEHSGPVATLAVGALAAAKPKEDP